ncbi:MAG: hypothetical protein MUF87_19620 [Anaerolineae bacterium]|jgi:hypothetical protein|nr:hypothetical protein [Anaerolineae bacterium]
MLMLDVLALIAPMSIAFALIILGLLSRKLGRVTHARPYYGAFFVASALIGAAILVRWLTEPLELWMFVYNGLLALGVTLGVLAAWRYWSWLLAERD